MKKETKIVALAGSLRKKSFNKVLVKIGADISEKLNTGVKLIDLADYPLPVFNEDLEANESLQSEEFIENITALRQIFKDANGLLIASPEYNGSFSAVLKNTLDWLSRPSKEGGYQPVFHQYSVGLMAASPGGLGGIRGLSHLREIMSNLGCVVAPNQLAVGDAYSAFDEQGQLANPVTHDRLENLVKKVVQLAQVE